LAAQLLLLLLLMLHGMVEGDTRTGWVWFVSGLGSWK